MSFLYAKPKDASDHTSPRSSIDAGEANNSAEFQQETKAFLAPPERGEDVDQEEAIDPGHRSKIFRCVLQVIILLLSLGLLFAGYDLYRAITASRASASLESSDQPRPCGDDPLTARSKGCLFDPIAMAWLPNECHDFELTKEFLEMEHWQFWAQPVDGQAFSLANVYQGLHSALFVRESYLRHRCVFAWRKIHRAIINTTAIDGYATDWDGIRKCEELFKGSEGDDKVLHKVNVGYPTCTAQRPVAERQI
ncbi:hypothetical protein CDD83_2137 [Cordyceps sp. RAO-2017]|nr:hypothetical protein CDD83_2137 [Cordyceps sp. RAO-2017]